MLGLIIALAGGLYLFEKGKNNSPIVAVKPASQPANNQIPQPIVMHSKTVPQSSSKPSIPAAPAPGVITVEGVMADGNHNVALINNNIYEAGALVNGTKILQITANAVTIEHDGKQEIIEVKK